MCIVKRSLCCMENVLHGAKKKVQVDTSSGQCHGSRGEKTVVCTRGAAVKMEKYEWIRDKFWRQLQGLTLELTVGGERKDIIK